MHLNAGKRKAVQHGLLNDETIKGFTALAVVEPYIFQHPQTGVPTISQDRHWQIFEPTEKRRDGHARHAFRAALWVNRRCRAISIPADSYDIAAALIRLEDRSLVVMACYEARNARIEVERETDLARQLRAIESATQRARREAGDKPLDVLLCTDLNRHHVLWGGHQARMDVGRRNEGEPIIDFMQEVGLHSLLPVGTITWEHQSKDLATTVDVILGSVGIREKLEYCRIHTTDYGSDHKPVALSYNGRQVEDAGEGTKRLYRDADWGIIRAATSSALGRGQDRERITDAWLLDEAAKTFLNEISMILEEHVPRAKESPYAKRWWTKELSTLRKDYTIKRNRVTTLRRRDEDTTQARMVAHLARRTYLDEIDKQKKQHWKDFLDNPDNIWKAARYAKPFGAAIDIPELSVDGQRYQSDEEKAKALMEAFFPTPPMPEASNNRVRQAIHQARPLEWPCLTKHEVERAIFRSNPDKAPGIDEISFRVWRELWPAVGDHLLWLYSTSLELRHVPKQWKTARIITLRKPGKADYTRPKAFRPISLLPTISKGLEAVVAARLSYMTEKYNLLPVNHFGARPRRSAEQALNVLVEKIYQAWRGGKILTLISFDVKGAFNGVHSKVLERRLAARRVPKPMVEWIGDFCTGRHASVTVGRYESEVAEIEYAGIPQGSPLSPLLYVFYNADLVERSIDGQGGSIGFVDDFNAWVVGADEEENTAAIENTILPHTKRWARQSGATFEADKTSLIHFTKRAGADDTKAVHFNATAILPQQSVKVLGVTLDKKLAMDEHLSRVINKGTRACLSLQAIKGTRPAQMRQLFRSCVLPITDYAASAWYGHGKVGVVRLVNALEKVQRLGARLITRAWKKVALPILEAEACLEPTKERLDRKVSAHVAKLISLPKSNPAKSALLRGFNVNTQVSPLGATVAVSRERLKPNESRLPIEDPPWIQAPWIDHSYRVVIKEKDQAIKDTATIAGSGTVGLYTDASVAKRLAAIAVVKRTGMFTQVVRQDSIGWASTCGVLSAEIAAIAAALKYAQEDLTEVQQLAVFSDSQQALRAIQAGNDARTGRALLSKIAESTEALSKAGIDLRFRWSPGHEGIVGNEEADDAAREASSHTGKPTAPALERVREVAGVIRLINRDRSEDPNPFDTTRLPGQYTWKMDRALPGKHTLLLYGSLTSDQASILIQARTGHCRLNQYLSRAGLRDDAKCGCGHNDETIKHVLLWCPRWADERRELRAAAGDRSGDISYLLGGWGSRKDIRTGQLLDGPKEKWKPDLAVVKATIRFLEKTGRLTYQQEVIQAV